MLLVQFKAVQQRSDSIDIETLHDRIIRTEESLGSLKYNDIQSILLLDRAWTAAWTMATTWRAMSIIVSGVPISTLRIPTVIGASVPANVGKVLFGCLWCFDGIIEMMLSPNAQPLRLLKNRRKGLARSVSAALGGSVYNFHSLPSNHSRGWR